MNTSDNLSEFEKELSATYGLLATQKGLPYKLNHLQDFPFPTLSDLKTAYKDRKINLGGDYNSKSVETIATKLELYLHLFLANIPFIIIIIDIIISIVYQKWILLLGIPSAIIGFFSSSQYNPVKNSLYGFSGFLFIVSFFIFSRNWIIIIGSLFFSLLFPMIARQQYKTTLIKRALKSEELFCFLFQNKMLRVFDIKADEFIEPKE